MKARMYPTTLKTLGYTQDVKVRGDARLQFAFERAEASQPLGPGLDYRFGLAGLEVHFQLQVRQIGRIRVPT